jgi:ribonuclease HI
VACDILWYYRNQAFHNGITFVAQNVSMHINKIVLKHFQAWQSVSSALVEKWIPPAPNWVKINFDIAIRDSFSAQAVVCRNSNGKILHLSSLISSPCSVNEGEALAAQLAISLACSFNFDRFIIEGDSVVVIQALNQFSSNLDWRISPIIINLLDIIHSTSFWEARKVNRSANFCTHSMARLAITSSHTNSISFSYSTLTSLTLASGIDPVVSIL